MLVSDNAQRRRPGHPTPWEVRLLGGLGPGYETGCIGVEIRGSTNGELQLLYRLPMASRSVGVSIGSALFVDTRHGKEGYSDDITSYDAQGIILTGGVSWMMMPKLSIEGRAELPGGSTLPVVAGHRMMPAEWVERP